MLNIEYNFDAKIYSIDTQKMFQLHKLQNCNNFLF